MKTLVTLGLVAASMNVMAGEVWTCDATTKYSKAEYVFHTEGKTILKQIVKEDGQVERTHTNASRNWTTNGKGKFQHKLIKSKKVKCKKGTSNKKYAKKQIMTPDQALKLCEFEVKRNLTHPNTFRRHIFDTASDIVKGNALTRMGFTSKNGLGMKIDNVARCVDGVLLDITQK